MGRGADLVCPYGTWCMIDISDGIFLATYLFWDVTTFSFLQFSCEQWTLSLDLGAA